MSEPQPRRGTLSTGATPSEAGATAGTARVPPGQRLELRVGSVLAGKYRLERALGFGGMGAVWVARNAMTGGDVALKVLHEEVENAEALERFRREANLAARLSHRGIVRVFDLVELHEGTLVMVMELLRGETLASRLDKYTTVPVDMAISITLAIASALSHAHEAGIVHRDLKPENVFLCLEPDGAVEPKILDFGISKVTGPALTKLTGDGTLLGTPGYMSPEQTRGDHVDARSDVFALAILLYEMIAGTNPFYGTSYNAVIAAILEREPEPLAQVSPEVWKVIERAFSKKRTARQSSSAEFASELRTAAGYAGRGSSPMFDASVLPPQEGTARARLSSNDTPTRAIPMVPVQRSVRLIAAVATVALLGGAAYVHFRAAPRDADLARTQAASATTTHATAASAATAPTASTPSSQAPPAAVTAAPAAPPASAASSAATVPETAPASGRPSRGPVRSPGNASPVTPSAAHSEPITKDHAPPVAAAPVLAAPDPPPAAAPVPVPPTAPPPPPSTPGVKLAPSAGF